MLDRPNCCQSGDHTQNLGRGRDECKDFSSTTAHYNPQKSLFANDRFWGNFALLQIEVCRFRFLQQEAGKFFPAGDPNDHTSRIREPIQVSHRWA